MFRRTLLGFLVRTRQPHTHTKSAVQLSRCRCLAPDFGTVCAAQRSPPCLRRCPASATGPCGRRSHRRPFLRRRHAHQGPGGGRCPGAFETAGRTCATSTHHSSSSCGRQTSRRSSARGHPWRRTAKLTGALCRGARRHAWLHLRCHVCQQRCSRCTQAKQRDKGTIGRALYLQVGVVCAPPAVRCAPGGGHGAAAVRGWSCGLSGGHAGSDADEQERRVPARAAVRRGRGHQRHHGEILHASYPPEGASHCEKRIHPVVRAISLSTD